LILGDQKLKRLFVATLDAINQKLINVAFCYQCLIPLADAKHATLWNLENSTHTTTSSGAHRSALMRYGSMP
jgi:hypothetical protein